MWTIGDIGYASIGWVNMICILLLTPVVIKVIRDYDRQRKTGIDPVFDPRPLNISGADFWVDQAETLTSKMSHGTVSGTGHAPDNPL